MHSLQKTVIDAFRYISPIQGSSPRGRVFSHPGKEACLFDIRLKGCCQGILKLTIHLIQSLKSCLSHRAVFTLQKLCAAEWNERRCPCLNMLIYDQTQSNPAFCTSAGRRKSSGYNRNGVHFFRNERRCSMLLYACSIKLTRLYIKSAGIVNVSYAYDFFRKIRIFYAIL